MHRIKWFLPILVAAMAACDDSTGPGSWNATPDTVLVYSASRPEYIGYRSAVDIVSQPVQAVPIEAAGLTGNWDFALAHDGGSLALLAAAGFEGLSSRSGVAVLPGANFDDVDRAPSDTAAYSIEPVRLQMNSVYIIRSRRASCGFSEGYRYAKLRPLEIDVAAGTLRFVIIRNPWCDDRSLIPPDA